MLYLFLTVANPQGGKFYSNDVLICATHPDDKRGEGYFYVVGNLHSFFYEWPVRIIFQFLIQLTFYIIGFDHISYIDFVLSCVTNVFFLVYILFLDSISGILCQTLFVDPCVSFSFVTPNITQVLWSEWLCPPQIHMLKSQPQCDGISRWSLQEVIRSPHKYGKQPYKRALPAPAL